VIHLRQTPVQEVQLRHQIAVREGIRTQAAAKAVAGAALTQVIFAANMARQVQAIKRRDAILKNVLSVEFQM